MRKEKVEVEEVAQAKYICVRTKQIGDRSYAPGEFLEAPAGVRMPDEFLNCDIAKGPYFFALREIIRNGRTFKPGEIWNFWKEDPPMPHFAPLEDRQLYTKFKVSNEYELRKIGE